MTKTIRKTIGYILISLPFDVGIGAICIVAEHWWYVPTFIAFVAGLTFSVTKGIDLITEN